MALRIATVCAAAAGDFNGDGKPDIAVTNQKGLSVRLNAGNGAFQPGANSPLVSTSDPPANAVAVAAGDDRPWQTGFGGC